MTRQLRYPVTPEWAERVREALTRDGRGGMSKLAETLGIHRSELSEVLACHRETSDQVEAIHAYFGWAPPLPPTAALDAGDTLNGYMRLERAERDLLDTAYQVLRGVQGEQAKRALVELLRLCRSY